MQGRRVGGTVSEPPPTPNNGEQALEQAGLWNDSARITNLECRAGVHDQRIAELQQQGYYDGDEVNLADYLLVMIRRRWVIAGCTVLAALAATFTAWQPQYTAEARLSYPARPTEIVQGVDGSVMTLQADEPLKAYSILARVATEHTYVDTAGNTVALRFAYHATGNVQNAAAALETALKVTRGNEKEGAKGNLTIAATHLDSTVAASTVNAYIDEFVRYKKGLWQRAIGNLNRVEKEKAATLMQYLSMEQLSSGVSGTTSAQAALTDLRVQLENLEQRRAGFQKKVDLYESEFPVDLNPLYAQPENIVYSGFTRKLVLLGGVLGLFGGVFAAFALEYLTGDHFRRAFQASRNKEGVQQGHPQKRSTS
ncbi:hypothetical protein BK004_01680 [bacterium CG10_46_32]|nr:MAG: hypothetical protein BK004_01680 [bacterium CG10_46_32]PIR56295.1 MAG: hypothetical protein COU73_01705 [Parcubacteria group bacterium CG10_big_fil_rev_8_21_14_0_10_46_32]